MTTHTLSFRTSFLSKLLSIFLMSAAAPYAQAFFDADSIQEEQAAAEEAEKNAAITTKTAIQRIPDPSALDTSQAATGVLNQDIPKIQGPKRVVSVGKFTTIGAFTSKYGSWDIGGGLAAMLATALQESERFIVVERAQLQTVLSEQEMKGQKVSSGTGPQLGKMLGVQLLIVGAVTEFGGENEGSGFSLGFGGGNGGGIFGQSNDASIGLSRQSVSGTVAMDIRIIDTTTGRIMQSFRVAEKIDNSSWDVSLGYQAVSVGTNKFLKTPLGEATRNAINKAVRKIAVTAGDTAWQGRVVDFDQGEVYINAGVSSGLKKGDAFTIERVVKRLTDPETHEILMVRKKELGLVEVEEVLPKISIGSFQALDIEKPKRGDLAVMVKK